jgi:molybdopterin molybdotransferase
VAVGLTNNLRSEGFQNLTEVDDALRILLKAVGERAMRVERVNVQDCLGRVLGEDIVVDRFIPPVDRSVMDGYAVRSEDVKTASQDNPVTLQIVGESRLGEACRAIVRRGEAVAVATGSMMPSGADAVVIVETTATLPDHRVAVQAGAISGQNISKKGEDVSPGTVVLKRGHRLRSQDVGILVALGLSRVRVAKRPKVAIISTGNEVVDSQGKADVAKIVDLNRPILSAMTQESGGVPVDLGIARDREEEILRVLRKGLASCDIVLVSAGSSVGRRDIVPKCINMIGKPGMLVHGLAMRPSLPTGLAVVKGKPILSLPGFPVSAILAFRVFGRPLIARLMGAKETLEPVVKAVLKERISGPPGYRAFFRVMLRRTSEGLIAEPLGSQRSSILMSIVAANGIVTIPEQIGGYDAGRVVDVTVIGEIPT